MKNEKGAALLLEIAIILPMVLFIVIVMYFSAMYVIQKNMMFARSYHYSNVAAKVVDKPQLMTKDFNVSKEAYINQLNKPKPYAFLKHKTNFLPLEQHINQQLQQRSVLQLEQSRVNITKKTNGIFIPRVNMRISYQTPIFELLQTTEGQFSQENINDGFVATSPIINQVQFINHLQLAKQMTKKIEHTQIGQTVKDIWHKINYFLNKLRR